MSNMVIYIQLSNHRCFAIRFNTMATGGIKTGECIEMEEMASSSSKLVPSTAAKSRRKTSEEDSDLEVLSSRTATPLPADPVTSEASAHQQTTSRDEDCSCGKCNRCRKWFGCLDGKTSSANVALFTIAAVVLIINDGVSYNAENDAYYEVFYACLLVMYCSLFTCLFKRGRCAKFRWPLFDERKVIADEKVPQQESTKDTTQTDASACDETAV